MKTFRSLSSRAESSSDETPARNHPGQSRRARANVALRGRTTGTRAVQRATADMVADPIKTKLSHNSPDPCARPDDPQYEVACDYRPSDLKRDNRDDKAPAARLRVRRRCR